MIRLSTPGDVLNQAIAAAQKGPNGMPDATLGHLRSIREHLRQRGMLNIAMAASSVEALFDEASARIFEAEEKERRHAESFESHKPL